MFTLAADWDWLSEFFFVRAMNEAETVSKLANQSECWNKFVKCQALVQRTHYELAAYHCQKAINTWTVCNPVIKNELIGTCLQGIRKLKELQLSVPREYLNQWAPSDQEARREWVHANFNLPLAMLLKAWEALRRAIVGQTWYQEVRNKGLLGKLNAITSAPAEDRSWHSGHFCQCPNGHSYIIGECGGAMEKSTCPECGVRIGGDNDREEAAAGNTHEVDFVNRAYRGGGEDVGWGWGSERSLH